MKTSSRARQPRFLVVATAVFFVSFPLPAAAAKKGNDNLKEIAGTSEFLRLVPKRFATLKAVDQARRQVSLLIEGEKLPTVWPLTPDAEVRVSGWWGRLDQLTLGDRVWAWLKTSRADKPVAIFMLADEVSEQDIHGTGLPLVAQAAGTLTVKLSNGVNQVLKTEKTEAFQGKTGSGKDRPFAVKVPLTWLKSGAKVYLQSAAGRARFVLDGLAFQSRQGAQKAALRKRWLDEGLPGTVVFLHVSGEMDYMLDHEAMRWGRSLKKGDKVSLAASPSIPAVVKRVHPWRERTQLRLVVKGSDLADLTLGQRLGLKMPAPAAAVENSQLPPDLGRFTGKKERVEWFLASMYCTCGVTTNVCTGHFYTLASCNPNACGMPNFMRKLVAEKIDKGLADQRIFEELLKEYGPDLVRPHLLP
jgi:hypothetical protein